MQYSSKLFSQQRYMANVKAYAGGALIDSTPNVCKTQQPWHVAGCHITDLAQALQEGGVAISPLCASCAGSGWRLHCCPHLQVVGTATGLS